MNSQELAARPCERCRKRRVKCDRRLPGCIRCEKLSVECNGFQRTRKFVDQGTSLRRKFGSATSQASSPGTRSDSQPRRSSTADIAHHNERDSYLHTSIEQAVEAEQDSISSVDAHTDYTKDTAERTSIFDFDASAFFDIDPEVYFADENNCCGIIPHIGSDNSSLSHHVIFWGDEITTETLTPSTATMPNLTSDASTSNDEDNSQQVGYETPHLIRHFVEAVAPCMDVFNADQYFAHTVPTKADKSPLLRNSIAAVAAKQFGRTRKESDQSRQQSNLYFVISQYQGDTIDWLYKAASYYDKAICLMLLSLRARNKIMDTRLAGDLNSPRALQSVMDLANPPTGRRDAPLAQNQDIDNVLTAASLFLQYESLDHRKAELLHHMAGAKHLLTEHREQPSPGEGSDLRDILTSFGSRKTFLASFWHFAWMDCIVSYADQTAPMLDVDNLHLWTAAGLPMNATSGNAFPKSLISRNSREGPGENESIYSRILIWLTLKALRYAASQANNRTGPSQSEEWNSLRQALGIWTSSLPDTFGPCLKIPGRRDQPSTSPLPSVYASSATTATNAPDNYFGETFFSNPMVAVASLLYHFTQILLLLRRPSETEQGASRTPRNPASQLHEFRRLSEEIDKHTGQICAIALGRPGPAVRPHMLQPLHLAGLCLESNEHRSVLVDLLDNIQKDTGTCTDFRINDLKEAWGWDMIS